MTNMPNGKTLEDLWESSERTNGCLLSPLLFNTVLEIEAWKLGILSVVKQWDS